MKEIYRGYSIESEDEHLKITSPEGKEWRVDKGEAHKEIDEDIENEK